MPSTSVPTTATTSQNLERLLRCYHEQCQSTGAEHCHGALCRVYSAVDVFARTHVCRLDLSALYFGPGTISGSRDGFQAFVAALAQSFELPVTVLTFTDTLVGDRGLLALSHSLLAAAPHRGLTCVTSLTLSGCGLCDVQHALPSLLDSCPVLRELDLSLNRLGCAPDGIAPVTAAAARHSSLCSLNLAQNLIGGGVHSRNVRALCEMLVMAAARPRDCAAFTRLDLRDNQLGAGEGIVGASPGTPLLSSHPLLDALLLNNDMLQLELTGNALSSETLAWADAKVAMNNRARDRLLTSLRRCDTDGGSVHAPA